MTGYRLADRATRVPARNPFDEECEYFAICLPAFSPEGAGRERASSGD